MIAGNGHARTDQGAPTYLPDGASSLTVAFLEVQEGSTDLGAYAQAFGVDALPFDYVWFTPRDNDDDPCAELEQRFSGHGEEKESQETEGEEAEAL